MEKYIIKIKTIFKEEIIVECYNYNDVRNNIDRVFRTNLGAIPIDEVNEVSIIN